MEAPKPTPSAADIEAAERKRVEELKEYRKNKRKIWYLK